jgi:hypothetical protein
MRFAVHRLFRNAASVNVVDDVLLAMRHLPTIVVYLPILFIADLTHTCVLIHCLA